MAEVRHAGAGNAIACRSCGWLCAWRPSCRPCATRLCWASCRGQSRSSSRHRFPCWWWPTRVAWLLSPTRRASCSSWRSSRPCASACPYRNSCCRVPCSGFRRWSLFLAKRRGLGCVAVAGSDAAKACGGPELLLGLRIAFYWPLAVAWPATFPPHIAEPRRRQGPSPSPERVPFAVALIERPREVGKIGRMVGVRGFEPPAPTSRT
jgi:hypothetical protein